MKILLDHNIPHQVRFDYWENHEVVTARKMHWEAKKNGELLGLMTLNGFRVLITVDKSLHDQQNLTRFPIVVVLLQVRMNVHKLIQPLIPKALEVLRSNPEPGIYVVSE